MTKKRIFWESFIIVIIIIAIIELFIEDLSRIYQWNVTIRGALLIVGFLLDLIFTIEFIVRSIISRKEKGWTYYFLYEKGWIDFLSSIPLILFNSGPIMVGMFWPGKLLAFSSLGILNILKITKILRIARILRMMRILKLLKSEEKMQLKKKFDYITNTSRVIAISILTITIILMITPFFPKVFYNMDNSVQLRKKEYVNILKDWYFSARRGDIERINFLKKRLKEDKNVLYLYYSGKSAINNLNSNLSPSKVIPTTFFYTDYKVLNYLNFKLWYSIKDIIIENSQINILLETIIVSLVIAFLLFYMPYVKKINEDSSTR